MEVEEASLLVHTLIGVLVLLFAHLLAYFHSFTDAFTFLVTILHLATDVHDEFAQFAVYMCKHICVYTLSTFIYFIFIFISIFIFYFFPYPSTWPHMCMTNLCSLGLGLGDKGLGFRD